jgi:hypothetical protein
MLEGKTIQSIHQHNSYGPVTLLTTDGDELVVIAGSNALGGYNVMYLNGERVFENDAARQAYERDVAESEPVGS